MLNTARQVWAIAADLDIKLRISHIAGVDNVLADALSRAHLGGSYRRQLQNFI